MTVVGSLRARPALVLCLTLALTVAACGGGDYAPTPVPSATTTTPSGSTPAPAPACPNPTQSYAALPALPRDLAGTSMGAIKSRGYLVAGVSADSLLLGSRNPLTGQIEGFDIDLVKAVATAIFGSPDAVQLVVITSSERIPALTSKRVDLVARNMTMTCDRWNQIAFSAEYYHSGLKILVRRGSTARSLADLAGQKVCAPNGTSTMDAVRATAGVEAVGATTHTGCLVLFQQGAVAAIAGDDTVLAGLAAQDPYAVVPAIPPLTAEPYGLGVNAEHQDFVAYLNRVLDDLKSDGRWTSFYDRWLAASLGPAPAPPVSVYGRR